MEESLKLILLEGKTGDSFIVECGLSAFIIDGGTKSTSKHLKKYLQQTDKELKGIFITHVDRDHIGGLVKLFSNHKQLISKEVPVFMNHPDLINVKASVQDMVSYDDGDRLSDILNANGFKIHGANTDDILEIQDVKFEILNPTKELAAALSNNWKEIQFHTNLDKSEDLVSSEPIIVDFSVKHEEHKKSLENDIVNASSISFILSYMGRRILFLSDSHPDSICNNLKDTTKFDCVKISHHGSKFNTTLRLLDKIDCTRFIISTNGPRNYGHPSPSTISKIIESCIKKGHESCDIIFNYKKVADRIEMKNVPNGFAINLIHSQSLEIQ